MLADLSLPDSRGFDTFTSLRDAAGNVPIVLLTGTDDETLAVRALGEGAEDYLVKGRADGQSLVRAVRYAVERARRRRLERDNAALEAEVRARTLAQLELERLAARLEASNAELQRFAFVASHDLQEPLHKIVAFGDRLKDRFAPALGEQGGDYLERMRSAATRMQALIDDLLELSRVVRSERAFQDVDLGRVVHEVLGDLEMRIEAAQAEVRVGSLPVVQGDRTQLRQVFQNLLSNALKFQAAGTPPRIEVDAELVEAQGPPRWRLRVTDNGIGFDAEYAEKIFEPFQRLHGRGTYAGTGIGLAIVRRVAQRHGGKAWAEGRPGRGATFVVELPAKD